MLSVTAAAMGWPTARYCEVIDLVLRDHPQRRLVVPDAIGPGQQAQDLTALDDARARIGRVRAHRGGDAGPHPADHPGVVGRHLDLDHLLARVNVGEERLAARGDPLHGSPERERHRDGREVVLVDVDLDPERAADVGRDHPHAMLGARRTGRRAPPASCAAPAWTSTAVSTRVAGSKSATRLRGSMGTPV